MIQILRNRRPIYDVINRDGGRSGLGSLRTVFKNKLKRSDLEKLPGQLKFKWSFICIKFIRKKNFRIRKNKNNRNEILEKFFYLKRDLFEKNEEIFGFSFKGRMIRIEKNTSLPRRMCFLLNEKRLKKSANEVKSSKIDGY